jgi:hypothetical protein
VALAANSYGSVAEVEALTRRILRGEPGFGSMTTPTIDEVEKMIDRVSAQLNTALAAEGFAVPVTGADAKLALDDWTVARVVQWVELTQPSQGWGGAETGGRTAGFSSLYEKAAEFVRANARGWKRLGASVTNASSEGLAFTALNPHDQRDDPASTLLEQPHFRRGQFDNG